MYQNVSKYTSMYPNVLNFTLMYENGQNVSKCTVMRQLHCISKHCVSYNTWILHSMGNEA